MEDELKSNLFECAAAFAEVRGVELVTVARLAAGDWRFFGRIEGGSSFTARKYDLVISWFSDNWPLECPWPQKVPRPAGEPVVA